jgi:hypothetical protein
MVLEFSRSMRNVPQWVDSNAGGDFCDSKGYIQFFRRTVRASGGSASAGTGRTAQLSRDGYVRDGDESPKSGVFRHFSGSAGAFSQRAVRAGHTCDPVFAGRRHVAVFHDPAQPDGGARHGGLRRDRALFRQRGKRSREVRHGAHRGGYLHLRSHPHPTAE